MGKISKQFKNFGKAGRLAFESAARHKMASPASSGASAPVVAASGVEVLGKIDAAEVRSCDVLFLHDGEGGIGHVPIVPGSRSPCRIQWGLNVPGLAGCTLVIPPQSWNEEEVLQDNQMIIFYVLRAHDRCLHVKVNDIIQRTAQG